MLKKLWNDPVWSKVIATGIIAVAGLLATYFLNGWPVIVQYAKDAYNFALSPTPLPNWIIGVVGLFAAPTIITTLILIWPKIIGQDLIKRLVLLLESRLVTPSASATGLAGPQTIERAGVRFYLDGNIFTYLGKLDPIKVPSNVIDAYLQGPFCRKCHHTLVYRDDIFRGLCVNIICPSCQLKWHQSTGGPIYCHEWKQSIYQSLDAEFRRTRNLANSDKQT